MRASKRSAARAAALYKVRAGLQAKSAPSAEALEALVEAIDANVTGPFGIRSIASLDLEAEVPPRCDLPWMDRGLTLLYYAAWRGRDPIVHALLRARAEPARHTRDASGRGGAWTREGDRNT